MRGFLGRLLSRPSSLRRAAFVVALGVPFAFVQVVSAAGDKAEKVDKPASKPAAAARDGGKRYDPDNTRAISQYMEQLTRANAKLVAKDVQGALEAYRAAIPLAPRNPLGHFYLGAAHLANNDLAEAQAAYEQAEGLSDDRNPNLRGKILFALADLKERQKKFEEARAAWQVYTEYAQKHEDAGTHAQTGASRMQALDDVLKMAKQYQQVRERIAAEKDGGAAIPSPDAGPPKK
jgi:tetratricopeptide (TPR) repeat protein